MHEYKTTITFNTDRKLTVAELEDLETALITQVLEPADHYGEDVEYKTFHQVIDTTDKEAK